MNRKLLSIICHVISATFIYIACFSSFIFLPLFGIYGLLALVCFIAGLAIYKWQSWERQLGLVLLSGSGFTPLTIIYFVSLFTSPEFARLSPKEPQFLIDYFSGVTTTLIVAGMGFFLFRKPLSKSKISKNSPSLGDSESDIRDRCSNTHKISEQPSNTSTVLNNKSVKSRALGINLNQEELVTINYKEQAAKEHLYDRANVNARMSKIDINPIDNMIERFTRYIELIKTNQSSYSKMDLYKQICDAISESLTDTNSLHKVRDLIKQIQTKLDSENTLLLNLYLMILLYSLATQNESKELYYFSALSCNNVIGTYYFMYQHEIKSSEMRIKCDEMIIILLSSVTNIELLKYASEIMQNQLKKQK